MSKNKCTILVNSCDIYEDAWYPFFKLLKKYWPDRTFPIVLNTETKTYDYEDMNIQTINLSDKLKNNKYVTWGRRMIEVLKRIDSEYIIFMLDDFFLTDYVDTEKLAEAMDWMDKDENKNIAVFSFYPVTENQYEDTVSTKYEGYKLRNRRGPYRYNCQAALWRKEELIKCFRRYENPWEWELNGNKRSQKSNKEFYALIDKNNLVFKYYFTSIGIIRGKWNLPETEEFFVKENIIVDYKKLNDLKARKDSEQQKNILRAKERGKLYYLYFRLKRKVCSVKNKIMTYTV